jgi:uncharacterized protein (AIM24 family)
LLPTQTRDESFGGVTYHLQGELVPVLHIEMGSVPVYFEHHILLWKDSKVTIGVKSLAGTFKRILSGMPIFMTEAHGPGHIAFSRDGVGHVWGMHLKQGEAIDVRAPVLGCHRTRKLNYTFARVKGIANMLLGGSGFFIDTFTAETNEGIVWLHGYGNVFEVTLHPGEMIDIEPGGWVYKDPSVRMETQMQRLSTGLLASLARGNWSGIVSSDRDG